MPKPLPCLCGALTVWDEGDEIMLRAGRGGHLDGSACPYVQCDQDDCRAKEAPEGENELRAALEHWRWHRYLHGCSHGR